MSNPRLPDPRSRTHQNQIIRVEEEKEKGEGELVRQGRDLELLQHAVDKNARERENMQGEMDMLLDRINKMSDMLDKSRVRARRSAT